MIESASCRRKAVIQCRHTLRAGFLAVAVCLLVSCGKPVAPTLRVGLLVWPPYEMATLAKELGYYQGANIEFVDYGAPAELVAAYERGDIDVMPTAGQYVFALESEHPGQHIILMIDESAGADALVSQKDITSLAQLKGKRVGYEASTLGAYVLTRALQHANLALSDIQPVSIDVINQASAFEQGLVDAVVTFEPTVTQLKAQGAHVLFDSAEMPKEIMDVLVTSDAAIDKKGELIQRFVSGWLRAVAWFDKHPREAAEKVSRREQLTPEAYVKSFNGVKLFGLEANKDYFSGDPSPLLKCLQQQEQLMHRTGQLDMQVNVTTLPLPRFVQAVGPSK